MKKDFNKVFDFNKTKPGEFHMFELDLQSKVHMNTWIDVQLYLAWFDFGEVCLRHYCLRTAFEGVAVC